MLSLFLYAFIVSISTLLIVIYFTHKYQLFMDISNSDKPQNFHESTTPRAGGIGILFGMLLILFMPFGFKFLPSILLAFISGIFEDFHSSLSPRFRLFLQFIAALSAVFLTGSVVTYLGLGINMPYWLGAIFSIFAIMGMMNAINIIDGFNGLASGIVLLILSSFAFVAYQHSDTNILMVIAIALATTSSFFILNFPKGKIFLGDGGAYLLGFIVAMTGIFLASKYDTVSPWYILTVFAYPVWEVVFSIVRKILMGKSPFAPDGYHFHMLIYKNITQNNPLTSLFIIIYTSPFILYSTFVYNRSSTNIIIFLCFVLSYLALYRYLYKKEN